MNYLELSIENVKEKTIELYNLVSSNYEFDLIIFIAKGGLLIGKQLANLSNKPLLEISAARRGGRIKKIIKPILKFVPKKVLISLRKREMNSVYHEENTTRNVSYDEKKYNLYRKAENILIVDDSIDTGNSIAQVKRAIGDFIENANIKVASLNVMKKAVEKPDFFLYEDTMIKGPWSVDSSENKAHERLYKEWKKNYEKQS